MDALTPFPLPTALGAVRIRFAVADQLEWEKYRRVRLGECQPATLLPPGEGASPPPTDRGWISVAAGLRATRSTPTHDAPFGKVVSKPATADADTLTKVLKLLERG